MTRPLTFDNALDLLKSSSKPVMIVRSERSFIQDNEFNITIEIESYPNDKTLTSDINELETIL